MNRLSSIAAGWPGAIRKIFSGPVERFSLTRLLLAILVGVFSAYISYHGLLRRNAGAADFQLPLTAARILLDGGNPYTDIEFRSTYPYNFLFYYPLPAVITAIPFTIINSPYLAGAIFFGFSSALMAYALLARDHWKFLPVFCSSAFFISASVAQWTPLIFGATLLPALSFLLACKPNLGTAGFFYSPSVKKLLLIGLTLAVSFIVFPSWFGFWFSNLRQSGSHIPPFLVLPLGPLLLTSAFFWRKPAGRLLFAMSIVPLVPWFYDPLLLWLVPGTLLTSFVLSGISWFAYLVWTENLFHLPVTGIFVNLIYIPVLIILFWENWHDLKKAWGDRFKSKSANLFHRL
jgi:hypothetical protein